MQNKSRILPVSMFQALILLRRTWWRSIKHKSSLLLILCIFISSMIASSLGFFSLGVQNALNNDIAKFLGAPLVVKSERPLPEGWWEKLDISTPAITASFTYGAIGAEGYNSITLKAVSTDYPKQDVLQLRVGETSFSATAAELKPSSAWLDARAMAVLGVDIGDQVQIGQHYFKVDAELVFEPDRLTQLQYILPRAMIRLEDLDTIGLDINNGKGDFRYLFDDNDIRLQQLENMLPTVLSQPYQVLKAGAGEHPFSRMAKRAQRMLGMVTALVLLLCGSAAAVLADFIMKQKALPTTVLRCMGLTRNAASMALLAQLSLMALFSGVIGGLMGWLIQPGLKNLLNPHLLLADVPFNLQVPALSLGVSILTIIAFVYPRLRALGLVPVASVLRGGLVLSKNFVLSTISALACVFVLLWYYSDNPRLTSYLLVGVVVIVIFSIVFGWLLSKVTASFHHLTTGSFRVVLRSVGRKPHRHIAPMATVALAVMAFLMTLTLQGSFLDSYGVQRFSHDGNFLFSRLPAKELTGFKQLVKSTNSVLKGAYPIVTASLVSINETPIEQALNHESDTREEARSPVRLSWSKSLPKNNTLLQGKWPQSVKDGVSVEAEVMSDLGLKIGDRLGFKIADGYLSTTITSTRKFKSGGSMVMFWFMFSPDVLQAFPQQIMGGIEINKDVKPVLKQLMLMFPQLLITDLEQQMARIRAIMNAMTTIMNSLLFLLIIAAITVLVASGFVSLKSQQQQYSLMRALGVSKSRLYRMILSEQGIIGLVSSLIGVLGTQIISGLMFKQQFGVSYQANWANNSAVILLTTFGFLGIGLILARFNLKGPIRIASQTQE